MSYNQKNKRYNNDKKSSFFKENAALILSLSKPEEINKVFDEVKKYMKQNARHLNSSQLRNIFAKLKANKEEDVNTLLLLRPKLAYMAARQTNRDAKLFMEDLDEVLKKVEKKEHVHNFISFFESIVAYHKFYDRN